MGEYATRASDGARIKIGTCEDMFYLRFEDRGKVLPLSGNLNIGNDEIAGQCRFRLPFHDEDRLQPGEYGDIHNRGLRLYKQMESNTGRGSYYEDFSDPATVNKPGVIQLHHSASGLLLNIPCYHGIKLPEVGANMKAFWNGKGHSFELSSLRAVYENRELRVYPVVRCRHCDAAWRYSWSDVLDYIEPKMRERLQGYAVQTQTA